MLALEVETAVSERVSKLLSGENMLKLTVMLRDESDSDKVKNFLVTVCPQISAILEEEISRVKEKGKDKVT